MTNNANLSAISEGRTVSLHRATGETDIRLSLNLDGVGVYDVDTGNGFLDHMVSQISRHGLIDITLKAEGDLHTGWHHLVEDVGITLGRAFNEAIGDARGIRRMGHAIVPLGRDSGHGGAGLLRPGLRRHRDHHRRLDGGDPPTARWCATSSSPSPSRAKSTYTPRYSPA